MSDPNQRRVTRDFTRKRPVIDFSIDDDVFRCKKALDLPRLQNFVSHYKTTEKMDEKEAIGAITNVMKIMLRRESYDRFMARFMPIDDPDDPNYVDTDAEDFEPIDHFQAMEVVKWVLEQYTNRPTEPSSNSSAGSPTDGEVTSSTAGASPAASTSDDFTLPTRSTSFTTT